MPAAIQALLDDAAVDIETWIASEVDVVLAEQESAALASGDGVNKPRGFPVLHGDRRYRVELGQSRLCCNGYSKRVQGWDKAQLKYLPLWIPIPPHAGRAENYRPFICHSGGF